jgi:hypothetical protein
MKKFNSVVSPIHPPLGDIKVLSIGIIAWWSDSSLPVLPVGSMIKNIVLDIKVNGSEFY